MRVESPFCEESSVHFILTHARGLGILTIKKIIVAANVVICCLFVPDFMLFVTKTFLACSCFSPLASFL